MTTTVTPATAPAEVCAEARRVPCGHCWRERGLPCVTNPDTAAEGLHMARFIRAHRKGLISETELGAVLHAASVLTHGSVIWQAEVPAP